MQAAVWQRKSFLGMTAKIFFGAVQWLNSTQSWNITQKYFDEEGHNFPESVQQYIETSLPILTWTIIISKIMRVPLALLYLKWPSVSRTFFVFELLINAQEAFLMFPTQLSHIQLIFIILNLNYILLALFDFGKLYLA